MEFLYENGLVHQAVPVDAGFHVAFPFVKIDVVTGLGQTDYDEERV